MPRSNLAGACCLAVPLALFAAASSATAQDWTNSGGNAQRNGMTAAYGPLSPQPLWSSGPPSIAGWQPVVVGDRVFVVRQTAFGGGANDAPIFALDLATGAQLWRRDLPTFPGDWTTHVLGARNGLVFAARSGNSSTAWARLFALDAATGNTVWTGTQINAGAYDSCVFADNGDLIVAGVQNIWRIRASDGGTVWTALRQAPAGEPCGPALFGNAVYVVDLDFAGQVLKRYDATTGAYQYESPALPGGYTNQHHPMVGPDGTVYVNRATGSPLLDQFFAFTDTGTALLQRWAVPSEPMVFGEFACSADGSVYMVQPGEFLARLDAQTGAVRNTYPVPLGTGGLGGRVVVDADGRVYFGNGFGASGANGALMVFDRDLTLLWQVPVPSINIGGPVLAADGTLVVAGIGADLRAYRTPSPWTNLGGGIAGALGEPALAGLGTLTAGNTVTFRASNAAPNSLGVFIFGASAVNVPIFGGTLVPSLDVTLVAAFDAQGRWSLGLPWPANVPTGATSWWQMAVLDLTAPAGFAASAGLRSVAP